MIMRFVNRQDRDSVFANRRMLKNIGTQRGYKIFVNVELKKHLSRRTQTSC